MMVAGHWKKVNGKKVWVKPYTKNVMLSYKSGKDGNAKLLFKKYAFVWSGEKPTTMPKDFFYVKFVPPSVARQLSTGSPHLTLDDSQNDSPTMRELIEYASKNGGSLGGYVIPEASGRGDARITFDTLFIENQVDAKKIAAQTHPDEFGKWQGKWRLWWD